MAYHARHVLSSPGEVRAQVKFRRRELLFRHVGELRDPYASSQAVEEWKALVASRTFDHNVDKNVLAVPGLPITARKGRYLVGPTIHDMLVRKRWPVKSLPIATHQAWIDSLPDTVVQLPPAVMAWSVRDLDSLWPRPGQSRHSPRPEDVDQNVDENVDGKRKRPLNHPFFTRLASGGEPARSGVGEWVAVYKFSTCLINEHIYRVAAGVFGDLSAAYRRIAEMAADAWEADLDRALQIWERVRAAPGGVLVEDDSIAKLRPICSVSQEVERAVMAEVCQWLGIDPSLDVKRARGRPKAPDANQGKVLRVSLQPDGTVTGTFIADFEGIAAGAAFHTLSLQVLVSTLGALRQQNMETDAGLLEAWLDAAEPEWRQRAVSEDDFGGSDAGTLRGPDPYDVLGVERAAPMAAITAAYRRAVRSVHPDTSGASAWLLRAVIAAYKQIRAERATEEGSADE